MVTIQVFPTEKTDGNTFRPFYRDLRGQESSGTFPFSASAK